MPRKSLSKGKKSLPLLRILKRLKPFEKSVIINYLNDEGIEILSNFVYNSLYHIRLSKSSKSKLKRRLKFSKKDLLCIADPNCNLEERKKRIKKQSGSGIGILLSALLPTLATIIGNKI